jgi:hypothetical protein
MTQMSGVKEQGGFGLGRLYRVALQNFALALELLRGCGMILRARLLRTSHADGRCHPAEAKGPLSFRVHPSSVICCNGLNLSRGSRV